MVDDGRRVLIDLPFEAAVGATTDAIHREGLALLARIDVREHFKAELHHGFRQYMLLEAWVPALAFEEIRLNLDARTGADPVRRLRARRWRNGHHRRPAQHSGGAHHGTPSPTASRGPSLACSLTKSDVQPSDVRLLSCSASASQPRRSVSAATLDR
jgi:hypothetical protein